jgi:hypothetical protein
VVDLNLSTLATGCVSLGIGLGAGIKVIAPLFRRNGKSEFVPRTECKIIHSGQDKRHDDLMDAINGIKEDIRAIK